MRGAAGQSLSVGMAVDPIEASFRSLGRSVSAGVIAGLLVGGLGGRVVMRVSAVAADIDGALTEGGNRVGDATVGGTVALIIFGGGLTGAVGGLILFTMAPWLPRRTSWRAASFALALPAMTGATIVAAENRDFLILDPPELNIAMFLLLFALFGAVAVVIDEALKGVIRNPAATLLTGRRRYEAIAFAVPTAVVALLLLADEKLFEAVFILLAGVGTSIQLASDHAGPGGQRSRVLRSLGFGAFLGACIAGASSLFIEIEQIV